VRPYYAVKCNPDKHLLKTLSSFGAGFDCASGRELMDVADSGHEMEDFRDRVIYANPCKPKRDLVKAKALGSPTTVIDSFEEIDKLRDIHWKGGALVRLLVEDKGSLMPFSRKFGFRAENMQSISAYAKNMGIDLKGVSFHVGSGCQDPQQFSMAIAQSRKAVADLKTGGHQADMIDIGGGFITDSGLFEKYARVIRCGLGPCLPLHKTGIRLIAEPGRYFATNAFDLFVQVIGKKPSLNGDGWRFTIDESLYGQFSCIPFDHKVPQWVRVPHSYDGTDQKQRKKVKGTLFGRTCDSLDLIAASDSMEDLEVGDWLWFPNMGAYTSVTASEFNGFPKPPLHGTDHSIFLPDVEMVMKEGFADRFPLDIKTVSAVSAVGLDK
jgi:ornithine decarboxylase